MLSTFRIGRKDDDPAGASAGTNSPFGGRKSEKEKEPATSASHPFGPPRRSAAESQSAATLPTTAKEGEGGSAPNSPFAARRRSSASSATDKDVLSPGGLGKEDSEADDTESSATSKRLSADLVRGSSEGPSTPGTPHIATPPPTSTSAAAPPAAPGKVPLVLLINGQAHEFEYSSDWQVRAVFANLATKLTVDKNSSLYHPSANIYLEAQRDLQCYWDSEPGPLTLAVVTSGKPTAKEVKVRLGQIKRSVLVLKATTAGGIVMAAGDDAGFRPTLHVLTVADKPLAPSVPVWKLIGPEWAVIPVADLPAVNLRVHFVDEQVFKVLKVAGGTQIRGMIDACRKKWIVKIQDGGAAAEYGFWLKEDGEWLADDVPAFSLADRADLEFKRKNVAAADAAAATGGVSQAATALPSGGAAPAAPATPVATTPAVAATPMTEKAKKARREKVEKEVALFLQRRPPNSQASATIRNNDAAKRKPIECNLNYDVIDFCLGFLEKHNVLDLEGIYRISGNSDTVRHVWAAFCLGHLDYLDWQDTAGEIAHVVTGACKLYLRELEVPLLPWDTHQRFLACEAIADADVKLATVFELVNQLNAVSQHTLRRLMFHLWEVAGHEKVNRMSPNNLAIVFGPTIMRPEVQDLAEMLNNATKVDLCTYMILNREKLFDLEKLKPLTERTLGPMPVLEDSKAAAKPAAARKTKSAKPSVEESVPPMVTGGAESAPGAVQNLKATAREPKKSSIGSALQGATSRKSSANPRGYSDALQAMLADLLPEVVAGCMVFQRQMEVDPKAFRKHLKSLPPDQLIDMIQNLAKHVTAAPAGAGSSRVIKTITVGGGGGAKPATPTAATTGAAPASAAVATAETAVTAPAAVVAAAAAAPVAAASVAVAAVPEVREDVAPPRPNRPPPSLEVLRAQAAAEGEPAPDVVVEEEGDETYDTEEIMAAVAEGVAASASAAIEDEDSSPVKDEAAPVRDRALSIVDLTSVAEDEDEIVIGVAPRHSPAEETTAGGAEAEPVADDADSEEEIVIVSTTPDVVVVAASAEKKQGAVVEPVAPLAAETPSEPAVQESVKPPAETAGKEEAAASEEAAPVEQVAVLVKEAATEAVVEVVAEIAAPAAAAAAQAPAEVVQAVDHPAPAVDDTEPKADEQELVVQGDLMNALNSLTGADAPAEEVGKEAPTGQSDSDSDDLVD